MLTAKPTPHRGGRTGAAALAGYGASDDRERLIDSLACCLQADGSNKRKLVELTLTKWNRIKAGLIEMACIVAETNESDQGWRVA